MEPLIEAPGGRPIDTRSDNADHTNGIRARLGLWDAVSIVVGIVVGTAIYKSPSIVFRVLPSTSYALGMWLLGGILSYFGALCYAELATTYPRDGGDYEYLSRAFGRWLGFLFGWVQLTVVLSASIGAMAYAFADYGVRLWGGGESAIVTLAVGAVVALSITNALGVVAGKSVQNVLTLVKVVGLAAVAVCGLWGAATTAQPLAGPWAVAETNFGLAMVFVLYAYGGWNDAAFIAAEVRQQHRNLPRALFIGIGGVTIVYLLVNAAYAGVLGMQWVAWSTAPAAEVMQQVVGPWGSKAVSVLVMLSALGAINGMILTGSRVYATLGSDYRGLTWLGSWDRERTAPVAAIAVQALAAVLLILLVGTVRGRALFDGALGHVGLAGLPWDDYYGGFETLVAGSAPVFWAFFLMTGVAVFVLRLVDRETVRPFAIPLYPVPPIIFCATCAFMLYSSLDYARWLALLGVVPLAIGLPLYWLARR